MMYGNRGNMNVGMDRMNPYPPRNQEPMFNRYPNDRMMMNYQNQYPYSQGTNQENFYQYPYQ